MGIEEVVSKPVQSELPTGWISSQVKDAVLNIATTDKKIPQKSYLDIGLYPVIDQGQSHIGGYTNDGKFLLDVEPPTIVFGDHTKIVKYVSQQFAPGADGIKVLKPRPFMDAKFIYYTILHTAMNIKTMGYARHYQHLAKSNIGIPPLVEQQRIVAKIEELFSELDKGVENLRTAQQQLKIYRQALINDVLKAKDHSDSLTVPLSDLIGKINQGWSPKCELNRQAVDGEWAIIKTTAVQAMQYSQEECKPLPKNFEPRPEIEIKAGDFLMTRKGPRNRTGVVCLVEATRSKSMLCDTVYRFRCDETKIYPKYLELVLNSPAVVAELDRRKSGISDSGISLNHPKLKNLPIPLVGTVAVQKNTVDEVELKLGKITILDVEISQSLLKAEALRQSILKKAFSGQLVAQDPNDEPASVLLERIRAERAAQPKARGRKAGASA